MSCWARKLIALMVFILQSYLWVCGEPAKTWSLDDFEDGDLKAATGLSWFPLADDMVGGGSLVGLEIGPGGGDGSLRTLRLSGNLGGGARSFAGAWISLDRQGHSVDLRAFEGVRLRVKSRFRLEAGFRAANTNFMMRIEPGTGWRVVDVPFSMLAPSGKIPGPAQWDASEVQAFGVTTPQLSEAGDPTKGPISFEIDDVVLYGRGEGRAEPIATGAPAGQFTVPFTQLASIPSKGWIELAVDPERDGKFPSLPDATRLEAIPSTVDGILWIRVTLRERPQDRWMGLNVALDLDGDPTNGAAWWGANTEFKFDRLVTVWCVREADGCQGYIGAADADQAASGVLATGGENLRFAIDRDRRAYIVGIPRQALHLKKDDFRLVAAVGSALFFNDDVPGHAAVTFH